MRFWVGYEVLDRVQSAREMHVAQSGLVRSLWVIGSFLYTSALHVIYSSTAFLVNMGARAIMHYYTSLQ